MRFWNIQAFLPAVYFANKYCIPRVEVVLQDICFFKYA